MYTRSTASEEEEETVLDRNELSRRWRNYCTIWGSWMSVRLLMRAWLRRASSFRRLSLCCSIILFSSSIVFRLHSIDEICFRGTRDQSREKSAHREGAESGPKLHSEWISTCVWSCIMSASIFMLDSFSSLISWSKCCASSLLSTPEPEHNIGAVTSLRNARYRRRRGRVLGGGEGL